MDRIAVTASTYEETKKIILARYGNPKRIIQAHLNFLEGLPPVTSASPDELNSKFIECHRRTQALRALREDVNGYGRVLTPKILRPFPSYMFHRRFVHVKRQGLSERDVLIVMEFLGEEVTGRSQHTKYEGIHSITRHTFPQRLHFWSALNNRSPDVRTDIRVTLSVRFVSQGFTGLKLQ